MRKTFIVIAVAPLLLLTACFGSEDPRVQRIQGLTVACDTIAATVNTLTGLKREGRLSGGQIALVNDLGPSAFALCDPNNPPVDTVSALGRVNAVLAQLAAVAANPAR